MGEQTNYRGTCEFKISRLSQRCCLPAQLAIIGALRPEGTFTGDVDGDMVRISMPVERQGPDGYDQLHGSALPVVQRLGCNTSNFKSLIV